MPNIFRRKGATNYYARFQLKGRDFVFSTGTTKRSEALTSMRQMIAEKRGTLTITEAFDSLLRVMDRQDAQATSDSQKRNLLSQRQDMARKILGTRAVKLAFDNAWQAWLDSPRKRNPGATTIQNYRSQWDRFAKWAKIQKVIYLHEVTAASGEEYASDLWKSKVSPNTYNQHLNFLRGLFRALVNVAGLTVNPWEGIPTLSPERESRRMLTAGELRKVCKAATGDMRYMFGIGLYTGMRLGDVVTLQWDAIKQTEGFIEIMPMKTRRLKKRVRIPIHPVLNALLLQLSSYTGSQAYLFPNTRSAYLHDRSALSQQVQTLFKSCGIVTNEVSVSDHRRRAIVRVGFHSLRHSFVSLCAANRVPQVAIMELVGHGSPAMTALYSHAGDEQKVTAIAGLPEFKFGKSKIFELEKGGQNIGLIGNRHLQDKESPPKTS
jgi:integrase